MAIAVINNRGKVQVKRLLVPVCPCSFYSEAGGERLFSN